jgi:hypothetical protein
VAAVDVTYDDEGREWCLVNLADPSARPASERTLDSRQRSKAMLEDQRKVRGAVAWSRHARPAPQPVGEEGGGGGGAPAAAGPERRSGLPQVEMEGTKAQVEDARRRTLQGSPNVPAPDGMAWFPRADFEGGRGSLAKVRSRDVLLAGSRTPKLHFGRRARLEASEQLLKDWTTAQNILSDWWAQDGREIFGENEAKQTKRQQQMARKRAVFRLIARHGEKTGEHWQLAKNEFTHHVSDTCLAIGRLVVETAREDWIEQLPTKDESLRNVWTDFLEHLTKPAVLTVDDFDMGRYLLPLLDRFFDVMTTFATAETRAAGALVDAEAIRGALRIKAVGAERVESDNKKAAEIERTQRQIQAVIDTLARLYSTGGSADGGSADAEFSLHETAIKLVQHTAITAVSVLEKLLTSEQWLILLADQAEGTELTKSVVKTMNDTVSKFPWVKPCAAPGEPELKTETDETAEGDGDPNDDDDEDDEEEDDEDEEKDRSSRVPNLAWVRAGVDAVHKDPDRPDTNGWLGRVTQNPDSDDEVRLIWKRNGEESSYIHVRYLMKNPDKEVPLPILLLKEARDIAADDGRVTIESLKFRLKALEDVLPILDGMLAGDGDWLTDSTAGQVFVTAIELGRRVFKMWELPELVGQVLEIMSEQVSQTASEQAEKEEDERRKAGAISGGEQGDKTGGHSQTSAAAAEPAGIDAAELQKKLQEIGADMLERELEKTKRPLVETFLHVMDIDDGPIIALLSAPGVSEQLTSQIGKVKWPKTGEQVMRYLTELVKLTDVNDDKKISSQELQVFVKVLKALKETADLVQNGDFDGTDSMTEKILKALHKPTFSMARLIALAEKPDASQSTKMSSSKTATPAGWLKKGAVVDYKGEVGVIITNPDSNNDVRLRWKDSGQESGDIPADELQQPSDFGYQIETENDDEEPLAVQHLVMAMQKQVSFVAEAAKISVDLAAKISLLMAVPLEMTLKAYVRDGSSRGGVDIGLCLTILSDVIRYGSKQAVSALVSQEVPQFLSAMPEEWLGRGDVEKFQEALKTCVHQSIDTFQLNSCDFLGRLFSILDHNGNDQIEGYDISMHIKLAMMIWESPITKMLRNRDGPEGPAQVLPYLRWVAHDIGYFVDSATKIVGQLMSVLSGKTADCTRHSFSERFLLFTDSVFTFATQDIAAQLIKVARRAVGSTVLRVSILEVPAWDEVFGLLGGLEDSRDDGIARESFVEFFGGMLGPHVNMVKDIVVSLRESCEDVSSEEEGAGEEAESDDEDDGAGVMGVIWKHIRPLRTGFSSAFAQFATIAAGGVDKATFLEKVVPVLTKQLNSTWKFGRGMLRDILRQLLVGGFVEGALEQNPSNEDYKVMCMLTGALARLCSYIRKQNEPEETPAANADRNPTDNDARVLVWYDAIDLLLDNPLTKDILQQLTELVSKGLVNNMFDLMASSLGPHSVGDQVQFEGRAATVVKDLRPHQNQVELTFDVHGATEPTRSTVHADTTTALQVPLHTVKQYQTVFDCLSGAVDDGSNENLAGAIFDIIDNDRSGGTTREEIVAFVQRVAKFAADAAVTMCTAVEGVLQTFTRRVVALPLFMLDDKLFTDGNFTATSLCRLLKVPLSLSLQILLNHFPIPEEQVREMAFGYQYSDGLEVDSLTAALTELRRKAAAAVAKFDVGAEHELIIKQMLRLFTVHSCKGNAATSIPAVTHRDMLALGKSWLSFMLAIDTSKFDNLAEVLFSTLAIQLLYQEGEQHLLSPFDEQFGLTEAFAKKLSVNNVTDVVRSFAHMLVTIVEKLKQVAEELCCDESLHTVLVHAQVFWSQLYEEIGFKEIDAHGQDADPLTTKPEDMIVDGKQLEQKFEEAEFFTQIPQILEEEVREGNVPQEFVNMVQWLADFINGELAPKAPGLEKFDREGGMPQEEFVAHFAPLAKQLVRSLYKILPADAMAEIPTEFFDHDDTSKTSAEKLRALMLHKSKLMGIWDLRDDESVFLNEVFDTNTDDEMGKVYEKFWKSIDELVEEITSRLFALIDVNESKLIDRSEVEQLKKMVDALRKGSKMNMKKDFFIGWTRSLFALVDKDGDNQLGRREVVSFLIKKVVPFGLGLGAAGFKSSAALMTSYVDILVGYVFRTVLTKEKEPPGTASLGSVYIAAGVFPDDQISDASAIAAKTIDKRNTKGQLDAALLTPRPTGKTQQKNRCTRIQMLVDPSEDINVRHFCKELPLKRLKRPVASGLHVVACLAERTTEQTSSVRLWRLKSDEQLEISNLRVLKQDRIAATDLSFCDISPDCLKVAACGMSLTKPPMPVVLLWTKKPGDQHKWTDEPKVLQGLAAHHGSDRGVIANCTFSPDSQLVMACGKGSVAKGDIREVR